MSLAIAGMGCVTPLGKGADAVWERLLHGDEASATSICEQFGDRPYNVFRVPEPALTSPAPSRLRRASVISRFAATAGLEALQAARLEVDSQNGARIALIFAISNGGVIYTKRFYRDIVESGAQAASPLLFPETVFNAPASHLAAILGITGATYTLVGDSAVGILAIRMAEDLMVNEALDYCLVVGAEEVDWLLCDAYRKRHLHRRGGMRRHIENKSGRVRLHCETRVGRKCRGRRSVANDRRSKGIARGDASTTAPSYCDSSAAHFRSAHRHGGGTARDH